VNNAVEIVSKQLKSHEASGSLEMVGWTDLQTHSSPVRGSLTVVESGHGIPFTISRIFYIYGTTSDCERGAHAHRETWQAFIAIKGSFALELTNSRESREYEMKEPNRAIYVPPMIWARLHHFSPDAVCLVLANSLYDPADYIRDWDEFCALMANGSR
jgi:hypothetical protein